MGIRKYMPEHVLFMHPVYVQAERGLVAPLARIRGEQYVNSSSVRQWTADAWTNMQRTGRMIGAICVQMLRRAIDAGRSVLRYEMVDSAWREWQLTVRVGSRIACDVDAVSCAVNHINLLMLLHK